jgi:hypothetical protein
MRLLWNDVQMSVLICSVCKEMEAMTECEMCLDVGIVTKLCGLCFTPHYQKVHGKDPSSESRVKLTEDQETKIQELFDRLTKGGHGPVGASILQRDKYPTVKIKTPFDEMHSSVAARDYESHAHDVPTKNNKKCGKSRREVDMEKVAEYILEHFGK